MAGPRGHTVATIEPDGTRHVRWIPDTSAPAVAGKPVESARDRTAREWAEGRAGAIELGKKLHAALIASGVLLRFSLHHWQYRRDGLVVLDFWMKARGRASWRFSDTGMRKGSTHDLRAALEALTTPAPTNR